MQKYEINRFKLYSTLTNDLECYNFCEDYYKLDFTHKNFAHDI